MYQQALTIYKQSLGAEHPDTAMGLNNLAELYMHQGKYEQAEPLFQRALTIREQRLGSTHPETADVLHTLAELYHQQGQYEQAEPLFVRALTIYEQQLGMEHATTRLVRENYTAFLSKKKREKEQGKAEDE